MSDLLSRCWWMLTLRGVIAILFGLAALVLPMLSLAALLGLFAAYALLGGTASMVGALRHRKTDEDWWLPFLFGLAAVGAGIIAFVRPGLTLLVLVLLIGANALVGGAFDLAMAIRLRKTLRHEWLLLLNALVSIAFGVLVFLMPDAGALAIVWIIGAYALLSGILLLALAVRLRRPTESERRLQGKRRISPDRRATA